MRVESSAVCQGPFLLIIFMLGKLPGCHRVSLISGLECEMEWWNGIWNGIMSTQSYS